MLAQRADGQVSVAVGLPSVLAERARLERVLVQCAQSKADRPATLIKSVGGDRPLMGLSPLGTEAHNVLAPLGESASDFHPKQPMPASVQS